MIQGLSHITFIVRDLEKTSNLFRELFDAQEIYCSGAQSHSISAEKFFTIGGVWVAIMQGNSLRDETYNHVAFKIESEHFELLRKKIERLGLKFREARSRIDGEGESLYFYDYDNHLFELHTGTLTERLKMYAALDRSR